jgi:hypothetical protein
MRNLTSAVAAFAFIVAAISLAGPAAAAKHKSHKPANPQYLRAAGSPPASQAGR